MLGLRRMLVPFFCRPGAGGRSRDGDRRDAIELAADDAEPRARRCKAVDDAFGNHGEEPVLDSELPAHVLVERHLSGPTLDGCRLRQGGYYRAVVTTGRSARFPELLGRADAAVGRRGER